MKNDCIIILLMQLCYILVTSYNQPPNTKLQNTSNKTKTTSRRRLFIFIIKHPGGL